MNILLLGRKHIAKSEDIFSALQAIGKRVDALLFPSFHYASADSSYDIHLFGERMSFSVRAMRFRACYYVGNFIRISLLLGRRFRRNRYDILFAIDWFECCILLLYRFLFDRRARVLFYSYDYYFFSARFSSRYFISKVDGFAARHADITWVVNDQIRIERERRGIWSKEVRVVPLGIQNKTERYKLKTENSRHFLFVGSFKPGHSLLKLVKVFSMLSKEDTDFHIDIIGRGNLEGAIQNEIRDSNAEKGVSLEGFVSEAEIRRRIRGGWYAAGVAFYEDIPEARTVDPGKVKDYLSWGLPVITTSVNPISSDIESFGLGVVVSPETVESEELLKEFFRRWDLFQFDGYDKRIEKYIKERSFEAILSKSLPSSND